MRVLKKRFGYVRISSKDQNEARQIKNMLDAEVNERDIYIDKQSGKNFDRPQYQALKDPSRLREGDTIVFDSITRMGRSMDDTLKEYRWFVDNGINLEFIKEPMINTNSESDDVILKAIQQAVLVILTAFSEKERSDIRVRQAEGIEEAKKKGTKFGRPLKTLPEEWDELYLQWKNGQIKAIEFMDFVGMKKSTFYKKVNEYELLNPKRSS
ncbi:recombinase family protein [Metabacillus sp. DBTR6]|uniref:Recombinase family protein n=1 Tax=Metabacillus rhizolycopersici TaxID=2875709 RepID=A0ABS7USM6_9BACI|nr:recombinase family protein [Metabacillus rhizolycopersici]MBZ5751311.1 recombinase family protein [Metabacillus rhizolycopersici]